MWTSARLGHRVVSAVVDDLAMHIPFVIARTPAAQERQATLVRARLTLSDQIGLALRAMRRGLRFSQRTYAGMNRWSPAHQGRLETRAAELPLRSVVRGLDPTAFGLVVVNSPQASQSLLGMSVQDIALWIRARMTATGVSTRSMAVATGLSQSMVSRLRDPRRAGSVRLSTVHKVVRVLGSELAVGQSFRGGMEGIEPQSWPTAAVFPHSRGRRRRLAAHGWVRRERPSWFRWSVRPHLGMPPTWTAEAPREPRRGAKEPHGNVIAPPRPRDRAAAA